jgi:endonuclease/exonuclease/phosphatase (EEP) superfamily protein YafD
MALFSRLPLTNAVVLHLGEAGVPTVTADVLIEGTPVHLVGTHPLPPGTPRYARLRNEQLLRVADYVRDQSDPIILLGDLNATPWSPHFKRLLKESQLKNTARGHGLCASWPAGLPPLRIPIDHCLVSPSIHVRERGVGPGIGGDHLPLMAELLVASPPAVP